MRGWLFACVMSCAAVARAAEVGPTARALASAAGVSSGRVGERRDDAAIVLREPARTAGPRTDVLADAASSVPDRAGSDDAARSPLTPSVRDGGDDAARVSAERPEAPTAPAPPASDAPQTLADGRVAPAGETASPASQPSAVRRFFDELMWGTRSWRDGSPRFFFAEQLDAGYVYVRARSWLGYGKPHDVWGGLEVNPLLGQGGLGVFVGLAGGARYVTARVGARPFMSSERPFLAAADAHDRIEFNLPGSAAKYVALEAELTFEARIGPGRLSVLGSLTRVEGVPDGMHVYEETLRIIVQPPWVWRARGEYAVFVVGGKEHNVGVVVDVFGVPARDMVQVRAGLVARLTLSPQLEARLSLIPTVYSRDRLGLVTSDFTELGFRWRFATGR